MRAMDSEYSTFYTLITGASSGIGKALAIECAKRGMNLFLVALPDAGFDELAIELQRDHNIKVSCFAIDLTLPDAPQQVFQYSVGNGFKVNMLINNAGNGHIGKFEEMSMEKVNEMINLNIRALTTLTLLYINEMKMMEKACVVNVGSLGAYTPIAYKSVYMATKSFVYYFSKSLYHEYADTKIRFSVLMPGAVVTNSEVEARIKDTGFIGRISTLTPEYVAQYTMKCLDKGEFVIMPGTMNRLIFAVSSLIPSGILLYITQKVFNKSH